MPLISRTRPSQVRPRALEYRVATLPHLEGIDLIGITVKDGFKKNGDPEYKFKGVIDDQEEAIRRNPWCVHHVFARLCQCAIARPRRAFSTARALT